MSSTSIPIPPHRFAEAIKELPLANLHFKAAEIRNSISHLQSSNEQLQYFAGEGDRDCAEAIEENVVVIQRMEERIALLKREVEGRGFEWGKDENKGNGEAEMSGHGEDGMEQEFVSSNGHQPGQVGGSRGDEELARRLMEHVDEIEEGGEDGVQL
ncbi:hypothetical protein N7G274_003599 [Stereocaulon virgatum]|uniref:Uncharacterized protein n=1 Tax=Stereocaulon virgatum TaxID=373712 RepID=A0ABR4ADZ4_9LECA